MGNKGTTGPNWWTLVGGETAGEKGSLTMPPENAKRVSKRALHREIAGVMIVKVAVERGKGRE